MTAAHKAAGDKDPADDDDDGSSGSGDSGGGALPAIKAPTATSIARSSGDKGCGDPFRRARHEWGVAGVINVSSAPAAVEVGAVVETAP